MVKNVFLYVQGGDYAALNFEENYKAQEVYEDMVRAGVTRQAFDTDEHYIEVYIKEFDTIDPAFISFIRNTIMDHDQSKDSDFFEVSYLEV
jgi:hypothetical protein